MLICASYPFDQQNLGIPTLQDFTVLPSENYAPGGASVQCLMESLVTDINKLYTNGFKAWGCQTYS